LQQPPGPGIWARYKVSRIRLFPHIFTLHQQPYITRYSTSSLTLKSRLPHQVPLSKIARKASPPPKAFITCRGYKSKIFTPSDYSASPKIEAERQKNMSRLHGSNRLRPQRATAQEASRKLLESKGGRVQIFDHHDGGLKVGKGKGKVAKKPSVATATKTKVKAKAKAKVTKKGGGGSGGSTLAKRKTKPTPTKRKTKPTTKPTDVSLSERDLQQQRAQAWNNVFRLGGLHR
jgi:hypothetical protein